MSHPALIKPTHKAIQAYYQTLQGYSDHHVGHETALRSAFQNLLAEIAKGCPLTNSSFEDTRQAVLFQGKRESLRVDLADPRNLADTHAIVYTPQAIVDFMCASVVEMLQTEFGKGLGDRDVNILVPCAGTGKVILNLVRRMPKKDLPSM